MTSIITPRVAFAFQNGNTTTDVALNPEATTFQMSSAQALEVAAAETGSVGSWTETSSVGSWTETSTVGSWTDDGAFFNPKAHGRWAYLNRKCIAALTSDTAEEPTPADQENSDALLSNWLSQSDYESSIKYFGPIADYNGPSSSSASPSATFSEKPSPSFSGPSTVVASPAPTVSRYRYRGRPLNLNKDGSWFCAGLFPPSFGEEIGNGEGSSEAVAILPQAPEDMHHPDLNVDIDLFDTTGVKRKIAFSILVEHIKFQILSEGRHPANVVVPWCRPVVGEWTFEKAAALHKSVIYMDRDAWAYLQGPNQDENAREYFAQVWRYYGREDTTH